MSVLAAGLLGEPTGAPTGFRADVVAAAKRDLDAGEMLDGEGGSTVYGLLTPTEASLSSGALPVGLADGVRLARPVLAGETLRLSGLAAPPAGEAATLRRELESGLRA